MCIRDINVDTGKLEKEIKMPESKAVHSIAFSPNGARLASGGHDKMVRIWHVATTRLQKTLEGHGGIVLTVAFSRDGYLLASGGEDSTVRIWIVSTGRPQRELKGHGSIVTSVAFSPDDTLLVSGSRDHTARIWNVETWKLQQVLKGHSDGVQSVAFSTGNTRVASGSVDRTVCIWSVRQIRTDRNRTWTEPDPRQLRQYREERRSDQQGTRTLWKGYPFRNAQWSVGHPKGPAKAATR